MPESRPEEHFQIMFEYAPISLWEEDFSEIKHLFDKLHQQGIQSLEDYLTQMPGFVDECMSRIRVINVNQQTVQMFGATTKEDILTNLPRTFRDGMRPHMRSELI